MLPLHSEFVSLYPTQGGSYAIHDRRQPDALGHIFINQNTIHIRSSLNQADTLVQDAALAFIQHLFMTQGLTHLYFPPSLSLLGQLLDFDINQDRPLLSREKFLTHWLRERKTVHVAAGVILNKQNQILIGQRSYTSAFAPGVWEFPGGKAEKGENLKDAVIRELQEELGISVCLHHCQELYRVLHYYQSRNVHFHVFQINQYTGTPHNYVHETIGWYDLNHIPELTILQPDLPVIHLLQKRKNIQ